MTPGDTPMPAPPGDDPSDAPVTPTAGLAVRILEAFQRLFSRPPPTASPIATSSSSLPLPAPDVTPTTMLRPRPVLPHGLSPLARQVAGGLDPATARLRKPWGLLLHTSGRGVTEQAAKQGKQPIEVALRIYLQSQRGELHPYTWGGPHYVMDHDGQLYQIAPDQAFTAHAGGPDRAAYLDGTWIARCSAETVARWLAAWPGFKSPSHLYPSRDANQDYIGVEMLPCGSGLGAPMRPGMLFTKAQHESAIDLGRDLARRWDWPIGWHRTPRLLGHEDVQPLQRQNAGGGWDPGTLRAAPYWDCEYVRAGIGAPR